MIRQANVSDLQAIGHLWLDLVDYHRQIDARMPEPAPDGVARYKMRISSALHDHQSRVLIAEHESEVVGYIVGMTVDLLPEMFNHERSGFIADIYVKAEYRRHGYGRSLAEALYDWFALRGLRHIEWHVASNNAPALAFWRSIGGQDLIVRMRASLTSND